MKIKNTHLVCQLLDKYPEHFAPFKKLILTRKSESCGNNVHLGIEGGSAKELNEEIGNVASYLKDDNVIIFTSTPENTFLEFSKEGKDSITIFLHFKFDNVHYVWNWTYNNGSIDSVPTWNRELPFMFKSMLCQALSTKFEKEVTINMLDYILTMNVLMSILPTIVFLQMSKEKIKFNEINEFTKRGDILKGNAINNETPHKFTQVDCLWNVKSVSVGAFKVKGHFRLQKCGVGYSEVKLIFIEEFKKQQYVRKSTRELTYN
jgi:hypothetical protein